MICSRRYLRRILKERYGLKGYVRADFGAVNRLKTSHHMTADSKESIRMAVDGGLDVQGFDFSNSFWEKSLVSLVEEGKLEESVMDEAVSRVLRVKFELGLFENPYTEETHYKDVVRCEKHRMLSLRAAQRIYGPAAEQRRPASAQGSKIHSAAGPQFRTSADRKLFFGALWLQGTLFI